jgi:NADH dehydrogenase/NADH:ubiquinone oxidoreductase subunit G
MVKKDGSFIKVSWSQAFSMIKDKLSSNLLDPRGLTGPFTDVESALGLKDFMNKLGSSNINNNIDSLSSLGYSEDLSSLYRFNIEKKDLDTVDFCLLVGTNVR